MRVNYPALFCLLIFALARSEPALEFHLAEQMAWGDRAAAREQLIPGTPAFFYFQALQAQLQGDVPQFRAWMTQWEAQENEEIHDYLRQRLWRRHHLLHFLEAPAASFAFFQEDLQLQFSPPPNHLGPHHPDHLDPEQITPAAFARVALENLKPDTLLPLSFIPSPEARSLILRNRPPLHDPDLLQALAAEFAADPTHKFGDFHVHSQLDRTQLDELARLHPAVMTSSRFAYEHLRRLPELPARWQDDPAAHLDRQQVVRKIASHLTPGQNDLKALLLYHVLRAQWKMGRPDEVLFREYLEMPRRCPFMAPERETALRRRDVNWLRLNRSPYRLADFPPVDDDSPLVLTLLDHFMRTHATPAPYETWFEAAWLQQRFVKVQLLHGLGDRQALLQQLDSETFRAFRDRKELRPSPQNPVFHLPGEAVTLDIDVKGPSELEIRVYALNTRSLYAETHHPDVSKLDLSAFQPTTQRRMSLPDDPLRRHRLSLAFPEIQSRGVYRIDLVAGAHTSRVFLHIGDLSFIQRTTPHGQMLRVMRENGDPAPDPVLWLQDRAFHAGEHGWILLPASALASSVNGLIQDGDFFQPVHIAFQDAPTLLSEIYVDIETLLPERDGVISIRPWLQIDSAYLDPKLLKNVRLEILSTNAADITTRFVAHPDFSRNEVWTGTFPVISNLKKIHCRLTADFPDPISGALHPLEQTHTLTLDASWRKGPVPDLRLRQRDGDWMLQALDPQGHPIPHLPLRFSFYHSRFSEPIEIHLATNPEGDVFLGPLPGIVLLGVYDNEQKSGQVFRPVNGDAKYPASISIRPGTPVQLPYPYPIDPASTPVQVIREQAGQFLETIPDHVTFADNHLIIAPLPVGEYSIFLKEQNERISLTVLSGATTDGLLHQQGTFRQQTASAFPLIAELNQDADAITLRIENAPPSTRVTARALHSFPATVNSGPFLKNWASSRGAESFTAPAMTYWHHAGATDPEHAYILRRRRETPFAGSLLARPGLLLNPMSVTPPTPEDAETDRFSAPPDSQFQNRIVHSEDGYAAGPLKGAMNWREVASQMAPVYREHPAIWFPNLEPDPEGRVRIPLDTLTDHGFVEVNVHGKFGTLRQWVALGTPPVETRDLRHQEPLPPHAHWTPLRDVQVLPPGAAPLALQTPQDHFRHVRTFSEAFDLFYALGAPEALESFSFLKHWHTMSAAEKQDAYDTHASHELHIFLFMRDPEFFANVVRPYLLHKLEQTLIDRLLLGRLTPEDQSLDTLVQRNPLELALMSHLSFSRAHILPALRDLQDLTSNPEQKHARAVQHLLAMFATDAMQQAGDITRALHLARQHYRPQWELAGPSIVISRRGYGTRSWARRPPPADPASFDAFMAPSTTLTDTEAHDEAITGFAARMRPHKRWERPSKTREVAEQQWYRSAHPHPPQLPPIAQWGQTRPSFPETVLENILANHRIPHMRLQQAPLPDVLHWLQATIRNLPHPLAQATTIQGEMMPPFSRSHDQQAPHWPGFMKVTLDVHDVSVLDALKLITEITNLYYWIARPASTRTHDVSIPPIDFWDEILMQEIPLRGLSLSEALAQVSAVIREQYDFDLLHDLVLLPDARGLPARPAPPADDPFAALMSPSAASPFSQDESGVITLLHQLGIIQAHFHLDSHTIGRTLFLGKPGGAIQQLKQEGSGPFEPECSPHWIAFAEGNALSPFFFSVNLSLPEILVALSGSQLPDTLPDPDDGTSPQESLFIFERLLPSDPPPDNAPVWISRTFYKIDDETTPLSPPFETNTAYRMALQIGRHEGAPARGHLLTRIPSGSLPLGKTLNSQIHVIDLTQEDPQTLYVDFMFPSPGTFEEFPPHLGSGQQLLAAVPPQTYEVLKKGPPKLDSWEQLAHHGTHADVLKWLRTQPVRQLNLQPIAWRLQDREFFEAAYDLLLERMILAPTVLHHAILHEDVQRAPLALREQYGPMNLGPALDAAPILSFHGDHPLQPEHLEYAPFIHARAHPGEIDATPLHPEFARQYQQFLSVLQHQADMLPRQRLLLVQYLLTMERLPEAEHQLSRLDDEDIGLQLQLDYIRAWLAMRRIDPETAMDIAKPHLDHPVLKWRNRFRRIANTIHIHQGEAPAYTLPGRPAEMEAAADAATSLELHAEGGALRLTTHGLTEAVMTLYPVDLEMMFSQNPFGERQRTAPMLQHRHREHLQLREQQEPMPLPIPEAFAGQELLVEITSGSHRALEVIHPQRLQTRIMTHQGQLEVRADAPRTLLPKAYVKVYAQLNDGTVRFWKDGYTDVRGRFDYVSVTQPNPVQVRRFALLVHHPDYGSARYQVLPPLR